MPADWPQPDPPRLTATAPDSELPTFDDDGDLRDAWVGGARLLGMTGRSTEAIDVRLDDCDVSGVTLHDSVLRRMHLRQTRLRGVLVASSVVDDLFVESCEVGPTRIQLRWSARLAGATSAET